MKKTIKKDRLVAELECFLGVLKDDVKKKTLTPEYIEELLAESSMKFYFMTSIYREILKNNGYEYPGDMKLFEAIRER